VQALHAYVPGEQPRVRGLIKLNTNENPYAPAPGVLRAVRAATDGRLRLYPNPTAEALRDRLAVLHQCRPENIIIGNGSDELLALATRAFVEPMEVRSDRPAGRSRQTVQWFKPSYSLYPVLADIHGARGNAVPLGADFGLPGVKELRAGKRWDFRAALTFVTTPNAPTGTGYSTSALEELCAAQQGVTVLDEAYVDFAEDNALRLALKLPRVLVARTFSKAYSLCFQRVGYVVGHPVLITALAKIKDSYNVNGLGQVAALATLGELPYYRARFERIKRTRARLTNELRALGFGVLPSQSNFLFVRPPRFTAGAWLEGLRARRILVRWFDAPETREFLRITIGSEAEASALVRATRAILRA
jgi:histidinol-phosphate aminotransferase